MNEAVATPEPVATAPAKPVAKKKPAPKKEPKVKTKTETRAKTFHGVECPNGKFWNAKRQLIVEALRKYGAESPTTARNAEEVAKKAGAKDMDTGNVVRYCSDQEPLVAGGIVKKVKLEGQAMTSYYLTALGRKVKFDY